MKNIINQSIKKRSTIHSIISQLVFIYKGNKINLDIYNKELNYINSNIDDIERQIISLDNRVKLSLENYNYISKFSYNTMPDYIDEEVLAERRKHTLDNQIAHLNFQKDMLLHKLQELKTQKELLIKHYE